MKHILTGFNPIGAVALLALAVGCTSTSTSTPPQKQQATPHWDTVPAPVLGTEFNRGEEPRPANAYPR